jgi:ABC-2 type transport system ATP-binding protein
MSALETRDLRVQYHGKWGKPGREAVRGLNLRVEPGEVVGFLGPNGAGKSTTIKTLMGFVTPTSGEALLLDRPAGSLDARRQVGFLPEVALYYPWLTPLETLWMYGRLAGLSRERTRAQSAELLERVGLGGREQRVGIAQALLGDPQLLILDEVSSGLDPLGRRDLRNLMLDQKARGVTIFFSSHELSEVTQLCDRVILVNQGQVRDERRVDALLAELRRYWLRFRWKGENPPFPATRCEGAPVGTWDAEFTSLAEWRAAMDTLRPPQGELLDAGEREGALEEYFVRMVAA